jgi:phage FluMu gp28-like protein
MSPLPLFRQYLFRFFSEALTLFLIHVYFQKPGVLQERLARGLNMNLDILLPYQKTWIADESKVKVWEKSRRIGASYVEVLASVLEAAKTKEAGGQSTYYLSYSKEMTQQFARDCAFWAKHINAAAQELEEVVLKDEDKDITVYRIRFASGFEIWCQPSVPRSLRFKSGRAVIDEAAFVDDLDELLKAALAFLMWGGSVRILSTHNGDDNSFNELIKNIRAGKLDYSLHHTTFDDALNQGLYQRICLVQKKEWNEVLEALWRDEIIQSYGDGADEELFCVPQRAGTRYFPSALLETVSDDSTKVLRKSCADSFVFEAKEKRVAEFETWLKNEVRDTLLLRTNPVYIGEDFARSGDLTCIFLDELINNKLVTFLAIELRNVPFDQQWQTILYLMNTLPNFGVGAFDARGNGQMIAEYTAQEWPAYVYPVMITTKWYAENFPKLKERMEDGSTTIPDDAALREDFRVVGLKARSPCVLECTGDARQRRHGDGAVAKLMAVYAYVQDDEAGYMPMTYEAVKTENRYRTGGKDVWDEQAICMRNRRFQFSTRTAIPGAIFRFCTNSRRNASPSF